MNVGCWCVLDSRTHHQCCCCCWRPGKLEWDHHRGSQMEQYHSCFIFCLLALFVVFKYPQFVALLWAVAMASLQLVWIKSSLAIMAGCLAACLVCVSVCKFLCKTYYERPYLMVAMFVSCWGLLSANHDALPLPHVFSCFHLLHGAYIMFHHVFPMFTTDIRRDMFVIHKVLTFRINFIA